MIRLRAAVAKELPRRADLLDRVEIEVGYQHFVLIAGGLGDDLAARVAEVALAVKLANIPGLLVPHAIDGPNEVAVGDGVGRLLQFPELFGESSHGGGRIENDLGAVQP